MAIDTFGKRLRVLRTDRELSQIDLRDRLQQNNVEIGESYISELERTDKMPTLHVAAGMARVLDVSLDYLGLLIDDAPSWRRVTTPDYFSEEADTIARLVDDMPAENRLVLLSVARGMGAPSQRQRERAEARDILESVGRQFGEDVRREVEKIVRSKGLPLDSAA